jgi:ATP-dependent DNA helicase RecQ
VNAPISFRGVQEQVIARTMAGQHTLAVMPTGAGKSLCYQVPALAREGTALVISPLIALMHDQIRSAEAFGIKAACADQADRPRDGGAAAARRRARPALRGAGAGDGEGFRRLIAGAAGADRDRRGALRQRVGA